MGISQLLDFYDTANTSGSPEVGDIFYTPIPVIDKYKVLEVRRASPEAHSTIDFNAVDFSDASHFKERERLPIKLIDLKNKEEAILSIAKKRPCVVLGVISKPDTGTLPAEDRIAKKSFSENLYLVAPMFSCSTPLKSTSFTPTLVARIKALQYPQFGYLPHVAATSSSYGSIIRLDYLFPAKLAVGSHKCANKIHKDYLMLIQAQLLTLTNLIDHSPAYSEYLSTVKEAISDSLPPDLA